MTGGVGLAFGVRNGVGWRGGGVAEKGREKGGKIGKKGESCGLISGRLRPSISCMHSSFLCHCHCFLTPLAFFYGCSFLNCCCIHSLLNVVFGV